jgi:hypothetical protein
MRGIKFIFLVAVAIAGLTLSTGVGAATGKQSTPNAIAVGAHIRDVVIKGGGAQNNGRIPARVTRLLRAAATNQYCPGAIPSPPVAGTQTCRWSPTYTGPVTCLQASTSAVMVQTCDASQIQTTGNANNNALIVQVIWSQNPPSPQDGTQIVKLRQTALGTGSNNALISQYIKQSLGLGTPEDTEENELEPDASPTPGTITEKQESHQIVHLRQVSVSGNNTAPIFQFLRQRERAANAGTIDQSQNTDNAGLCTKDESDGLGFSVTVDPNANMCILLNQESGTGTQLATLTGDYNQFQRVRKAGAGSQLQGNLQPFIGGEDYGLAQNSTGVSNVLTIQNERQVQRAVEAAVTQSQNGPRKGEGSTQGTNAGDTWRGFQTSTQIQTKRPTPAEIGLFQVAPGTQSTFLFYSALTSGNVSATQTANQNGQTSTNSCSGNACDIFIQGVNGIFIQTCPAGQFLNPATGVCVSD